MKTKESLYTCGLCNWKYPEDMLNPMIINGKRSGPICGICALQMSNEVSGDNRTSFDGAMAEEIRQSALVWRDNHPHLRPKGH